MDSKVLIVVTKPWFSQSPWDSYVKIFDTDDEFLEWYQSLPEDSFTRKHGKITRYTVRV